ncbi:hypothetical protein EC396_00335 [Lutibacter sp. HS1-25]|uniref:helix-turn-helix transcriptional regulator n=1 Tax=Lutibacter sp. HS1-25 TaxID=2485000 RepID=UPI001010ACA6|nr:LuxR C-terminal-related transcriptional regulator [Lutibacter sp. HS1-25]RXP64458.1 hypothetical protein EC396_00335 [Lutibacter sp. HS1-25]
MANYQILSTKLNRPTCFHQYFKRERLDHLLEQGSHKVATIICAGAGYGKSTLVSQWVKNKEAIWLSCDADMNELPVFLSYVVHGFAKEKVNPFAETSKLLASQNTISDDLLINTFISETNNTTKKVFVVFDDFHLLKNPYIIKLVETYLTFPPQNIHVIILSRHDLIFSFPRYRLNNAILDIRMKDLNLTLDELKMYAKTCFDLALSKEQLNLILRKTEGWFLGVNQILYAYKELNAPLANKNDVLSQHQFSDYFRDEVITLQSEDSQKVLFICSLFSQFNKELVDCILNTIAPEISQTTINNTLVNKNNFIIGLDSVNQWYRFHHQFHEALNLNFKNHPFNIFRSECLQIGGEWLIKHHLYEDGIIKTIESGKIKLAVKQLHKLRYKLLNTDQYGRLANILSLFPLDIQDSDTELLLIKAFVLENQGKNDVLEILLTKLNPVVAKNSLTKQQLGEYKVLDGLLNNFSGNYKKALTQFNEALELLKPNAESIITFACGQKALVLNSLNKYNQSLSFLTTRLNALNKNQHQSIVRILTSKMLIYGFRSDLRNMQGIIPEIIKKSEKHGFHETHGMALYYQIELNYRTGKYKQCDVLFEEGRKLRYLMRPGWYGYLMCAQVYCDLYSNKEKLQESLNEFEAFSREENAENIFQLQNILLIEIALKNKNYKEVLQLHEQTNYHINPPILFHFLPQVTQLKVLLYVNETHNFDEFYTASKKLWDYVNSQSQVNLLLKLNIITSVAAFMQHKKEEAFNYMNAALTISEDTGDLTVYVEFSQHVYEILSTITVDKSLAHHLKDVLSFFEMLNDKKVNGIVFKERDIKILELVAKGHTNGQIADEMFLSPESVKKYLYHIFQDLDVKSRMNAVLEARRLGLIH